MLEDDFGQGLPNLALLVTAPDGVDHVSGATVGERLTDEVAGADGVGNVISYWTSGGAPQLRNADGDKALIMAAIEGDSNEVKDRLESLLPEIEGDHGDVTVQIGGYAMFERELNAQSEQDIAFGEMVVLPVTLAVLVVIFGSVVAATLPLLVAVVTMLLGMGLMWVMANLTDLSVFAVNAVTLLGLGLAIDYSLLMVSRYRDELRAGLETTEAIGQTMRTAGRTVLFSAVTVSVALSALLWFPLDALRSIGYAGITTALLAGATSLTVLPAMFALLGGRIEKWRVREVGTSPTGDVGMWHRLAMFVMRRPIPIATLVAAFLLVLGAPFLGITLGQVDERTMPESSQARQVADTVREEFESGEQNALQVVVSSADDRDVSEYAAALSGLDHVVRVDTAVGSFAGGTQVADATAFNERFMAQQSQYLSVVPEPGKPEAERQLVRDIRAGDAPFDVHVGGTAAFSEDGIVALRTWLPVGLAALVVVMLVLLFLLTGSVVLPFIAMLLSGLSITATFGALVWIFQDGNLNDLLGGFTVTGTIDATVPVMLFAIAFGLAMDYQVFMLSRITEEYEITGDPTSAVAHGLEKMGRIVTAAAVLISIVFTAFLLSDVTLMKAFGVGLPLAVLLDATLVRGLLLPAVIKMGGAATWWAPRSLRSFHSRYGFKESAASSERVAQR
jgi:RND superfamily putative drug exporter